MVPVSAIAIDPTTLSLTEGESSVLKVSIQPSNATDYTVSWTSSSENVASVSDMGLVSALHEGSAAITVSAGGKSAVCQVTVSKKTIDVTSVSVDPSSVEMEIGETCALSATVLPEDATNPMITWTSSDPAVVTVSAEGVLTAVSAGSASVSAAAGGKQATCSVTVKAKVVPVESIVVSPSELKLEMGSTAILNVVISPADATDSSVSWTSSDESVATVSSEGLVTGVAVGTVSVTATTTDGGFSSNCVVTVTASKKEILYKSTDGKIVTPKDVVSLGELISNTYTDGWGKMSFAAPVTTIGVAAFSECTTLLEIVLPESLISIGEKAFEGCLSLQRIYVPAGLEQVGTEAFHLCPKLEAFEGPLNEWDTHGLLIKNRLVAFAPAGVAYYNVYGTATSIADKVFEDCSSLLGVTFFYDIESIGSYVLAGCTSLESVYATRSVPPELGEGAFDRVETDFIIFVEAGREQTYKDAPGWHPYESHIRTVQSDERAPRRR